MYALVVTEPVAFDKAVNTTVNATGVGMLDSRCTNTLRTGACSGLRTGLWQKLIDPPSLRQFLERVFETCKQLPPLG